MTGGTRPHPVFAILAVTSVSAFVVPFMASAMNIALPSIAAEFAFGAVALTWVTMAYLLASAMLLLPFGRLADIFGRRRCFLIGTAAFTLFSGLAALASSGGWLITGRVLQGIGGAMAFPTAIAILTEAFPREQRGKALGINVTSTYLGLSLGPVLGGLLVHAWGWRSILWVNVPLGLVIFALAVRHLPADTPHSESRVDGVGSVLFSLALGLLVYGFSRATTGLGQTLIGLALLGFVVFGGWELRARHPMLDVRVFASNRLFLCSNLAALINYAATSAVGFLLSLHLQNVKGLTPAAAGVVLLVQPAIMTLLSAFAGALSDRVAPRFLASAGMAATAAGLLPMAWIAAATPLAWIVADLVLLGLGFAFFSSPNTNAVMGSVEKRHLGVASATLATMRLTGQVLSMGLAALVLSIVMGAAKIEPATFPLLLQSIRLIAVIFAVLCVVGVFVSLSRDAPPGNRPAG
ncbi:MAG TPA: MFS transporter [Opitutaceae bacterium]|nr:MFS transporter [Opitutaceae bacterium]